MYNALKLATEISAAAASLVGTPLGLALVVVEVDMKTEAGRLALQAAEEIRQLRSAVQAAESRANTAEQEAATVREENQRLQQFEPDAEDTSAEADLSTLLGGSGSASEGSAEGSDEGSAPAAPAPARKVRQEVQGVKLR